jgi:hypothetical protein
MNDVLTDIDRRRNLDGGFGPSVDSPSEPEPTALIALAFDDDAARRWLLSDQQADGSVGVRVGGAFRDVTALGALAIPTGPARERALDHVEIVAGRNVPDPAMTASGWPWTDGAHGWTEPTAWGCLALRLLRPTATSRVTDAVAMFAERECVGGGWNYGSRTTVGIDLHPYVQTTALALLALGGTAPELTTRGVDRLRETWRSEASGDLSLAVASCALRAFRAPDAVEAERRNRERAVMGTEDNVIFAWQAFALGAMGPWVVR